MRTSDLQIIEASVDQFIKSSIDRMVNPKEDLEKTYTYSFDVKKSFGRQRIREPLIEECKSYFESCGLTATYRETFNTFKVEVRLLKVAFTSAQAMLFNDKMASFGRKTQ
jgi:hypothetical protein